eukprot:12406981-Karenia_brevis.AAC.1
MISPSDILLPCLTVLPMGFSRALHLCQLCVAGVDNMVLDRSPGVALTSDTQVCGVAYVDNFGFGGSDERL